MHAASDLSRTFEALRVRLHYVNRAWTVDNYEALLRFFIGIVPRLVDAERCSVFILDPGSGQIISRVGTHLQAGEIEPPFEGSVVGQAISSGKCLIENALADAPGFHHTADAQTGFSTRSLVCAPIRSVAGGRVTGAIQVLNKRGDAGFCEADGALLQEVADYLSMALENIVLNEEILKLSHALNREVSHFRSAYLGDVPLIAESQAMREVVELARTVSATPVSVVIQGENGTGKEVIARMIHAGNERGDAPLVVVNCAAVPETLIESEFFGYEKGAFTGAVAARAGRFEEARGGTLFLDEIGDMPLGMQAKFLRAIQEGEGTRLGGNTVTDYDFRLISATNRVLSELVSDGRFREDLYYRLFAVEIVVPPLRERREDITPLALAFLDDVCRRYNKTLPGFSSALLSAFEDYAWPGNVRQLRREVERLVALTPEGQHLTIDRCSPEIRNATGAPAPAGANALPDQVRQLEIRLIEQALEHTRGNKGKAAAELGITRQGLHKKLKRYGLAPVAAP